MGHDIFQYFLRAVRGHNKPQQQQQQQQKGSNTSLLFSGNNENLIKNGAVLLEERISLFDGRTNPIRCFSVDDLNSMNVNKDRIFADDFYDSYTGVWNRKTVMVKVLPYGGSTANLACREIAVATEMGIHGNVHRLLGCCLETKIPVLVYECPENGTLHDRIIGYNEERGAPVEWKERLRIGWEIAHSVAYLHNAFRRPIIHRDLKPTNVFLDRDDVAKLSDFSLSISIPEGEKHVEADIMGTVGYVAPDYIVSGKLATSADVYAFGMLLLVLMTGKPAVSHSKPYDSLVEWVSDCSAANNLSDIVDPAMTGTVANELFERQLKALLDLAIRCLSEAEECRPTMVDVATEVKNIITLPPILLIPFSSTTL